MPDVLVISNPEDEHTRVVTRKVEQLGSKPILFYPETLGAADGYILSHGWDAACASPRLVLNGQEFELNAFQSIWYRRPRVVSLAKFELGADAIEFARDEWRSALEAAYALTRRPVWVSHPDNLRLAARKPFQLLVATALGFRIPRTCITNDARQARDFFANCGDRIIVKPTGSGWFYGSQDQVQYILTNRVSIRDLANETELEIAPITLQEEIPKAYEVRVNIVGQQVLAIKIDSQHSEISELDWRRYDTKNTPYTPYTLPPEIARACLELAKGLGLEFGAIDLIRTPEGEYVFLEINGNGQFLWAEELSGVEVSDALARLLTGNAPPLSAK